MRQREPIDWESVRQRLEENRRAMEQAVAPDPDRIAEVFRVRAALLARTSGETESASNEVVVLVFELGGNAYGLELGRLSEVCPQPLLAPVPGSPPALAGVMQLRGEIRPVWELSRLLDVADPDPGGDRFVLLLRLAGRTRGIRTGYPREIRTLRTVDLLPPPAGTTAARWITADFLTILDPDKLFPKEP